MSDHQFGDPFAAPGSANPEWQGTPVPTPSTVVPPPGYVPPRSGDVPPPHAPQGPVPGMAAYPPPPPAGYMYAPTYHAANTADNWMGVTSLVLSLASLVVGITCIPGVIIGHIGLSAAKKGTANNRGLALAGVIIGWVFVGTGLLFILGFLAFAFAIGASASG